MPVWLGYSIFIAVAVGIFIGYKILKKRMTKRAENQKAIVDQHKVTTTIFVIEKKKAKITEAKLPKQIVDQIPRIYKLRKMPLVIAKVGPQIVTLLCEENVFKKIPDKKNVRVDLAGIFIVGINEKKK
jgi:hypothetical protein